ncbi:MAG: hypothetical protein GX542_12275 [Rhodococcus sp.]|nr:hypothetical protein [Rhodococcus sp. (in: high G+C Gram-positive bacteria)]
MQQPAPQQRPAQPAPTPAVPEFDPFADNSAPPTWLSSDGSEPKPAAPPKPPSHLGRNIAIIGGGLVVCAGLIGAVVIGLSKSGDSEEVAQPANTPVTEAPAQPAIDENWCEPTNSGNVAVGNGPGGTASGPDVIFAFHYAYYVERDGIKAAEYGYPGIYNADELQAAADQEPPAEYCLTITEQEPNVYTLERETRIGSRIIGATKSDVITVPDRYNQYYIYALTPVEGG